MLGFEKHRKIFKSIKKRIENAKNSNHILEFEKSLEILIEEYDTSNHENRFVVGASIEILFSSLLNSLDFKSTWIREPRYDISIKDAKFSLKSNLTGSGDIRLINILGERVAEWKEPTIFFIGGYGIFYLDPSMDVETQSTGDARIIKVKQITKLSDTEWHIRVKIPKKQSKSMGRVKTASYDVAKSILEEINSKILIEYMPNV